LMKALGHGLLNKEIARSLQLKEATVKTYRKHVATSLGVSGSQLVRLATLYRCWCLDQQNRAGTKGNIQLP
jgi:DNA-binding NarL/FixJ family response regulator